MKTKREWLIQMRSSKGLSQREIASIVNITTQMYYYIENNERNPSVKLAQKIADVLGFEWTMFYSKKNILNDNCL